MDVILYGLQSVFQLHFQSVLIILKRDKVHEMDKHFRTAPLEKNIPATLALVGLWNTTLPRCTN